VGGHDEHRVGRVAHHREADPAQRGVLDLGVAVSAHHQQWAAQVAAVAVALWVLLVESDPWPNLTFLVSLEAIFLFPRTQPTEGPVGG
jgi:hypothetical protein